MFDIEWEKGGAFLLVAAYNPKFDVAALLSMFNASLTPHDD